MRLIKPHLYPLLFIFACTTGYLFDVLFLDKHLTAFDFVMDKPSWEVEFGETKAHNIFLSDSPAAHYPYRKEFWDAARQGYNTQYLPHIFSGKPTVGQGTGIFSTSLFQLFMDIPNALDFSTWFRLLLAAGLMYVFLLQLGLGKGAATLGGIAWSFNMHQIAWLMFPQHLATQLWLPLLLSINLLLLQRPRDLAVLLGLVLCVVFFYTSGYTQIVLYSFIAIGLFNTLYLLIVDESGIKGKLINWIRMHAVYLLAGLLLLPDALWQAQEISEGLRGAQEFRYNRYRLDVSLSALIQLFKDFVPRPIEVVRYFTANYHESVKLTPSLMEIFRSNVVEYQVFFGFLCLYFTAFGVIRSVVERNRLLIVWVLMLLMCIALSNGNPVLISLLNLIPFAGSGTYARVVTLVILLAIIIAAYGLGYFVKDMREGRYLSSVVAFLLILAWLVSARLIFPEIISVREFYLLFAALIGFIVLSGVLGRFKLEYVIPALVVAVTFAELANAGYRFNTRLDSANHFPENKIIEKVQSFGGNYRTALLMDHPGYQHNLLSYYDISTLGGYETTAPNNYLFFMRHAFRRVHITLNGILFLFDGELQILPLLNTRFVVSNLGLESDYLEPIYENEAEVLYEVKNYQQRAYCGSDQIVNENIHEIPYQFSLLAKELKRPVVLSESVVVDEKLTENCEVSNLDVFVSKIEFDVNTDANTLVFIPTNSHPYWSATVNGSKADIISANFTFMAIEVEAGQSHVKLEFINKKLTWAAALLIMLGLICLLAAFSRITSGWQKPLFLLCGLLLIGKNLMSIPGVMNTNILERPAVVQLKD